MLEGRVNKTIAEATEKSRIWRTLSEIMVGLTALMFLFVLGFILKRRVLYPVVRLSDVVQRLEQERDSDRAVRELQARITQRLQGCESFEDVIKVAELFAPNIAPEIPGRLYILDTDPGKCAAWRSGFLRRLKPTSSIRITAGPYGAG